jgi:hypothetical protein
MKEPELVVSGLAFLIPAYVAWYDGRDVSAAALSVLTLTSFIWHTIHEEWFRPFDFAAMVFVTSLEVYNSVNAGVNGIVISLFAVLYGFIVYYWGYMDGTFAFGPTRSIQMISHASIHIFAAAAITANLLAMRENEKRHVQTNSFS